MNLRVIGLMEVDNPKLCVFVKAVEKVILHRLTQSPLLRAKLAIRFPHTGCFVKMTSQDEFLLVYETIKTVVQFRMVSPLLVKGNSVYGKEGSGLDYGV